MSNLWKKLASLASALMMLICIGGVAPAHAENFTYTPVSGNTIYVNVYAFMRESAHTPAFGLEYNISPSEGMAADKKKGIMEIKDPSLVGGEFYYHYWQFNNMAHETTYNDSELLRAVSLKRRKDPQYSNRVENILRRDFTEDNTMKIMVAKIPLDFSHVNFKEPGVYRFKVTQEMHPNGNGQAIEQLSVRYAEDQKVRYLDVFVDSDESGKLKIAGSVMHLNNDPIINDSVAHKNDEFLFEYKTYDVTFGKRVTGNQGSKDQYFEFEVIAGSNDGNGGEAISVDLSNANDERLYYNDGEKGYYKQNPTQIYGLAHFYLKSGQTITLKCLAKGSGHVEVKEVSSPASDQYHTSWDMATFEAGNATLLEEGYKINDVLLHKLGAGTGDAVTLRETSLTPPSDVDAYDVSYLQDGSAYMWREDNTIYLGAYEKPYFNKNSANMFANCTALNTINLQNFCMAASNKRVIQTTMTSVACLMVVQI